MQTVITSTKAQEKAARKKRGLTIKWLRKIHGWLGLWGAVLGLLFGISGFLLNHRAVMKIPAAKMEEMEIQLPVSPIPKDAAAFTRLIQQTFNIRHQPIQPKGGKAGEPAHQARFMDKSVQQPQIFKVDFQLPQARIQAEYVLGNQFATVKREDANLWGYLTRMHKGIGANTAWVLLADSLAGAISVLTITGVLLWTKMRGSRLAMAGLMSTSTFIAVWAALMML